MIDTTDLSQYRSIRYQITVKNNSSNGYAMSDVYILFDDTNPLMTEYVQINSNGSLGVFSSNANSTTINLIYTPTPANTTVKATKIVTAK